MLNVRPKKQNNRGVMMLEGNKKHYETLGKPERCQPDYEGMIKGIKERLDKTARFRDAALAYFEGRSAQDKMAELIGELVTTSNHLQRQYESLIEAQEKDKTA